MFDRDDIEYMQEQLKERGTRQVYSMQGKDLDVLLTMAMAYLNSLPIDPQPKAE